MRTRLVNASLVFIISTFILRANAGCVRQNADLSTKAKEEKYWVLSSIDIDLGHDTVAAEGGDGSYHNYYHALVFKRSNETLKIVYRNELLRESGIRTGQKFDIRGLDMARYSDLWGGYWLHEVKLKLVLE